ncbi:MAG: DNA polymerase III subunit delta' [Azospirillaceae bacterium]|nr:DNA polymerase III subunit delta' [Azospirillaceae bacterium]
MTAVAEAAAPRCTEDLIGHAAAERALLAAWQSGRLPHAWLITGPAGIGKATLAFRFARFVLSRPGRSRRPEAGALFGTSLWGDGTGPETDQRETDQPETDQPETLALSAHHPVFHRIASGGHADLLTVERRFDEERGRLRRDVAVDDVRRIAPFLHLTPAEGDWRVVIVDGAERMNESSQNAILKILEEPPTGALLLLVAENGGAMKPTIRSRCRRLALEPLGATALEALIERFRPDLGATDRATLIHLAEGSIGRALDLATAGGVALYKELMTLLGGLPHLDVTSLHGFSDRLARRGAERSYETVSALLIWWLARLARGRATGQLPAEIVPGESALVSRLIAEGTLEAWMEVWEKLNVLFVQAETANLDHKQVMLNALLTLEQAL